MFAAIDIGTNSTLLLIGEVLPDRSVRIIEEHAEMTRLGEGMAKSGIITVAAAQRTMAVLKKYSDRCKAHGVTTTVIVGTEALRRATNAPEFLNLIKKQLGLFIEIISSAEEARLTFKAVEHDFGSNCIALDIGGGSTEVVGAQGLIAGLKFGSVLLTEQFLPSNPVTEDEYQQLHAFLMEQMRVHLGKLSGNPSPLVATAGTATTLAAMQQQLETYDQAKVHGSTLSCEHLQTLIHHLKSLTIEERKKLKGLHPDRAHPLLAGAMILEQVMLALGYDQVIVSDRGLRWGLFYERFVK